MVAISSPASFTEGKSMFASATAGQMVANSS